jgi:hypothetical protein
LNILGIQERLSWALDDGSADVIEIHHHALHFEVRRIEEAATREAQARGWDLNVIKDLVQMLESTRHSLPKVDRAFNELKAAHHAACLEYLAGEASEVLNGTKWWSRQDCMEFP